MLLTRRSRHLRNHKGEISFPGGRIDPGETPAEAALREAHEEVGARPGRRRRCSPSSTTSAPSSAAATSCRSSAASRAVLPLAPASPEVERVIWLPLGRAGPTRHVSLRALGPQPDRPPAALLRARRRDGLGRDGVHAGRPPVSASSECLTPSECQTPGKSRSSTRMGSNTPMGQASDCNSSHACWRRASTRSLTSRSRSAARPAVEHRAGEQHSTRGVGPLDQRVGAPSTQDRRGDTRGSAGARRTISKRSSARTCCGQPLRQLDVAADHRLDRARRRRGAASSTA